MIILYLGEKYKLLSIGSLSIYLVPIYLLAQVLYGQSTIFLRFTNKIKFMNIVTAINPYLFIIFILITFQLFNGLKLDLIFLSNIFSMTIIGSIVFYLIRKEIKVKVSIPSFSSIKEDMILGLPLALSFLVETIIIIGDRYIIALFLTIKEVGSYTSAYTIGGIIIVVAKVFNVIIPPFISKKIDNGEKKECINVLNTSLRVYLIVAIPFAFGSFILAKDILQIIANQDIAHQAWLVIPIIAFATIFFGVNIILGCILFIEKKTKILFKINFYIAILNLILNLFLISIFRNIEAAAFSTLISYFIGTFATLKYLEKDWTYKINKKFIIYLILLSLVMFTVTFLFKNLIIFESLFINVVFLVFLGGIQYLFLLILFKKLIIEEYNLVKKYIFD